MYITDVDIFTAERKTEKIKIKEITKVEETEN